MGTRSVTYQCPFFPQLKQTSRELGPLEALSRLSTTFNKDKKAREALFLPGLNFSTTISREPNVLRCSLAIASETASAVLNSYENCAEINSNSMNEVVKLTMKA